MGHNLITEKAAGLFSLGMPAYDQSCWDSYLPLFTLERWAEFMSNTMPKQTVQACSVLPKFPQKTSYEMALQCQALIARTRETLAANIDPVPQPVTQSYVVFPIYSSIGQSTIASVGAAQLPAVDASSAIKEELIRYVDLYLRAHQNIIKSAYRRQMPNENRLLYSIVLKEDSDENRTAVFGILNEYEVETFSSQYSISFQFYPHHLEDRIKFDEQVILQQGQANAAVY